MKFYWLVGLVLVLGLCIGHGLAGNYTELIEYDSYAMDAITPSLDGSDAGGALGFMHFPSIENYDAITKFEILEVGTSYASSGVSQSGTFSLDYENTGVVIGEGIFQYTLSDDGKNDRITYYFSWWNNFAYSGNHWAVIDYSPASAAPAVGSAYSSVYETFPTAGKGYNVAVPGVIHQTTYTTPYKARININTTQWSNGTVDITSLFFDRSVGGVNYPSKLDVRSYDGESIYINDAYAASGTNFTYIDRYPTWITVTFGFPTEVYEWVKTLYGDNPDDIINGTVTATPTPTPTPTEIPSDCGLTLSASVNKSVQIIPVSEYILATTSISGGTPTELQYLVLPGAGSAAQPSVVGQYKNVSGTWKKYVNDLGITTSWVDTTYEDALTHEMRFASAGNYYIAVRVYSGTCQAEKIIPIQVNPGTDISVWLTAYDALFPDQQIDQNMYWIISDQTAGTSNLTYIYNPVNFYSNVGHNISVYAYATGYEPVFTYKVLPVPDEGTHLDIPLFMFPTDYTTTTTGNTTLTITVKDSANGAAIDTALVVAQSALSQVSSGYTNTFGHVSLQVPFFAGNTRIDTTKSGYNKGVTYLNLNNATTYDYTIWLTRASATPTPTATYNPNATPTKTAIPTMTAALTLTTTVNPKLTVGVYNADLGSQALISGATVTIYEASTTNAAYRGAKLQQATTGTDGKTAPLMLQGGGVYWCIVSKTGFYESSARFLMDNKDSVRYVALNPIGAGVTVIPTSTSGGFVNGTGDYRTLFIDWMKEHFGVSDWAAGILVGLIITLIGAVFVGGCLAGFGSGEGAALGAIVGGCFGWTAASLIGFIPLWALIVSIAFVGLAFFVWRGGGGGAD